MLMRIRRQEVFNGEKGYCIFGGWLRRLPSCGGVSIAERRSVHGEKYRA